MKSTIPAVFCDHESGCSDWAVDWYAMTADNWRELMEPGWRYDPYSHDGPTLCPRHAEDGAA